MLSRKYKKIWKIVLNEEPFEIKEHELVKLEWEQWRSLILSCLFRIPLENLIGGLKQGIIQIYVFSFEIFFLPPLFSSFKENCCWGKEGALLLPPPPTGAKYIILFPLPLNKFQCTPLVRKLRKHLSSELGWNRNPNPIENKTIPARILLK